MLDCPRIYELLNEVSVLKENEHLDQCRVPQSGG